MSAPGAQAEAVEYTPAQMFELAARAEKAGELAFAEQIYRALFQVKEPELRNEARFRLAMLLKRQDKLTEAAVLLRSILDEQSDVARVRLELAAILTELGDYGAARKELRAVQALDLPPEIANNVTAFSNALRARKRLGASFEVSLAQDSNINRATKADSLDSVLGPLTLSNDAKARSGTGLALGGQAYYRQPIAKDVSLLLRVAGNGDFYRDSSFNDVSGDVQAGPEIASGADRISASVGYARRWYGGEPFTRSVSGDVTFLHPLSPRSQLILRGSVTDRENLFNDLQSGTVYGATASYERSLSARAALGVTAAWNRQALNDPGYSSTVWSSSAYVLREMGKMTLVGSVLYSRLDADERLLLFPERRQDDRYQASLNATFRQLQWQGFSPFARLQYERNKSTVGIYDYKRTNVEFGITRAF